MCRGSHRYVSVMYPDITCKLGMLTCVICIATVDVHLQQAIVHLHSNDSAIGVNDANLAVFNWSASGISQIATSFCLKVAWPYVAT